MIIGIIAGVLILACISASVLAARTSPQANNNPTPTVAVSTSQATTAEATPTLAVTATPATTSTNTSASPSGASVVPAAAAIITNPQSASAVNQDTAAPTTLTKTFKAKSFVYITFDLNLSKANIDIATQKAYVEGRFYVDGSYGKNEILPVDRPAPGGYVGVQYLVPGNGAAELYWCMKADCSDRQLAQYVTFTITS